MSSLSATTFKDSHQSFLKALDVEGIRHSTRMQFSQVPMASGIAVEIMVSGGWGVLAAAVLAWAHVRSSRKINVTLKNNKTVWLKGYSADEAARILESADRITVIDTEKDPDA